MKRLIIPFLSFIALPSAIQANIDPKVAEMCMKASDFQGCVKSMSGQKENNLTINSEYQKAITLFREGDSLKANKLIKTFLKKNPNSKEGWILKALINAYELDKYEDAIEDIDKALDIDDEYAFAHALKAEIFYWDLDGSLSKTLKYLEKGMNISPEDPHVNFVAGDIQFDNGFVVLGGDTFDLSKKSKEKKALSIKSFEQAKNSFEKTLANINLETYKNPLAESSYTLDATYTTTALLGDTKFELYFLYKDKRETSKAKQYLEEALEHYSKAISIAPSQEEVEKLELDRDLDLISPADLYRARGDVYSWMNNKWKKACSDWKVAKKFGDEGARDNFRNFKC
jgi:tetratricopeptide (TPR) repeat protein